LSLDFEEESFPEELEEEEADVPVDSDFSEEVEAVFLSPPLPLAASVLADDRL
jgi:hypothetical protein